VRTLQVLGPCSKTQYYCTPLCLPKPCTDPTSIAQLQLLAKGAFAPNQPPRLVLVLPDPAAFHAAYSPQFPIPQVGAKEQILYLVTSWADRCQLGLLSTGGTLGFSFGVGPIRISGWKWPGTQCLPPVLYRDPCLAQSLICTTAAV
jgi:hypothetical protein